MTTTITHSEISAVTAARIKSTPDTVGKTVSEYAKSMIDLAKEKKPASANDITLIETPISAVRIKRSDSGVIKNPDGTEQKIGANYKVNMAPSKSLLHGLNADIIDGAAKLLASVLTASKKVAS